MNNITRWKKGIFRGQRGNLGELVGRKACCDFENDLIRRHLLVNHRFHRLLVSHGKWFVFFHREGRTNEWGISASLISAGDGKADGTVRGFDRWNALLFLKRIFDVIGPRELRSALVSDYCLFAQAITPSDDTGNTAVVHTGPLDAKPFRGRRRLPLLHQSQGKFD